MHGCSDCRYCKVYRGGHWDPDEYECVGNIDDAGLTEEEIDTLIDKVWVNGEEWKDNEEPICPAWEEVNYDPEEEYWDRYAYEENKYDKDEAE